LASSKDQNVKLYHFNTARFFPIGTLPSFSGDMFLETSGWLNRVGELTNVN
jgi:hypothetical protein